MSKRPTPHTDALDRELHNPKLLSDRYGIMRDHACLLERERDEAREAIKKAWDALGELPDLVLANERKNPAWNKAEIWGIERDIIPSIRLLCLSIQGDFLEGAK